MKIKLDFSPRYWVVGLYRDRNYPRVRLYLPLVRLSIGKNVGWINDPTKKIGE